MSKNIDDVIKEVMKSNKEIHNMDTHLTKDILEVKKFKNRAGKAGPSGGASGPDKDPY